MIASNDTKELRKQLSEIAELRKRIKLSKKFMSVDPDELANLYCKKKKNPDKPVEPEKLPEEKPSPVDENKSNKKTVLPLYAIITIVGFILVILGITGKFNYTVDNGIMIWDGHSYVPVYATENRYSILAIGIGSLFILLSLWRIVVLKRIINRIESDKQEYERNLEKYNKFVSYNSDEYPLLMDEYKKELSQYEAEVDKNEADYLAQRKEFDEKYYNEYLPNAKKTLEESEKALSEYDGLISDKYIPYIDSLIEILEDGRADSLKEAINTLRSDQYNEQMLGEAREKNRILEQQRQDAEARAARQEAEEREYRNQMLEAQKRQAEAAERQERDARYRAQQAEREASRRQQDFDYAKKEYSRAVYNAANATDQNSKARYEEQAAKAFAEMQKNR